MKLTSSIAIIILTLCALAMTSCRSHKEAARHKDSVSEAWNPNNKKTTSTQKRLVKESLAWVGTPYRYGGSDKGKGTDCSGLVLRVYQDVAGVKLPRQSRKQAEYCREINRKAVRAGDLVFFATGNDERVISHVGIMIDEVRFVHASTKKGVIVSDMETPYYRRTFRKYGRVPNQ